MSDLSSAGTDPAPVEPWYLSLFGSVDLRGPDAAAAESVLVQPKHVALLALLLAESPPSSGRQFSRRDRIVALLWPELDQSHARAALRRVVHQLRGALGAATLVSRGDEEIGVERAALSSDVEAFTEALAGNDLARALDLYEGDMMAGFHLAGCVDFQRWLDERRDHFRREAGAAAWVLAQRFEADMHLTMAGQAVRRAARFYWDDERMLRRALEMLARLGDHSGALRLYDEFAARLSADYDARPSPETSAIVQRIRNG